jgi:predicted amidohydrolase YtcJ
MTWAVWGVDFRGLFAYFLLSFTFFSQAWGATGNNATDIPTIASQDGTYTNALPAEGQFPVSYGDGTLRGSLILHNGRIHTMDAQSRVVSVLGIKDGWVVYAGDSMAEAEHKTFSGASGPPRQGRKINLKQHITVPGLIDCHTHIVLLGNRPGYHTPLENAFTIGEVLDTYRQRLSSGGVPPGAFITTIGGFSPTQFGEGRLPTLPELDSAVPDHPVFISTGFAGPASTNSLGKAFFEALPGNMSVAVAANGSIVAGMENGKALFALRQRLSFDDRVRSAADAMAYAASVGVTTLVSKHALHLHHASTP